MKHDPSHNDRGVITAMFAVLSIFLVLFIAVLAEGGRKINNLGRAEDIAAEAARAAAATLDVDQVGQGVGVINTEDGRAQEQALAIIQLAGLDASLEGFDVDGDRVTVAVRVSGRSFLPGFDIDGVGSHEATAFNPFP